MILVAPCHLIIWAIVPLGLINCKWLLIRYTWTVPSPLFLDRRQGLWTLQRTVLSTAPCTIAYLGCIGITWTCVLTINFFSVISCECHLQALLICVNQRRSTSSVIVIDEQHPKWYRLHWSWISTRLFYWVAKLRSTLPFEESNKSFLYSNRYWCRWIYNIIFAFSVIQCLRSFYLTNSILVRAFIPLKTVSRSELTVG